MRTGKSTFIKRFMESLVIPNIENVYKKERAKDELPQSGSGKTIMTAEPKFVPEEAAELFFGENTSCKIRLVDCVGYMVEGALGDMEGDSPRMVITPWSDAPMTMSQAAEIGTTKVISEHSTIGLVITTDGTVTDIERENYIPTENRVIEELKLLNKPFLVLVNSNDPTGPLAKEVCQTLYETHNVSAIPVNCATLDTPDIMEIIKSVLFEFPISEIKIALPRWINALDNSHNAKTSIYEGILEISKNSRKMRDIYDIIEPIGDIEYVSNARLGSIHLGNGTAHINIDMPSSMFYDIVSEQSGLKIRDEADLIPVLSQLSKIKAAYEKIDGALRQVRQTGYGIVMPSIDELTLEEPEIVKQGGRFGVKLRASAPSIHLIRADIQTEVSPIVGSEKQSEELIHYLLSEFDGEPGKIWQSNIFGKSLNELVSEGLNNKLNRMPEEARAKIRETLERIINEGSGGLICIIL